MNLFKKASIFALALPTLFSCASITSNNVNESNNKSNSIGATNAQFTAKIYCDGHCRIMDDRGDLYQHLEITGNEGDTPSLYFVPLGPNKLPSDIFSMKVYDRSKGEYVEVENGETPYYMYELMSNFAQFYFMFYDDTIIEMKSDANCVEMNFAPSAAGEEVGFSYNGGLDYVDWGDGTVNHSTTHTYLSKFNYTIKVVGNIRSVSLGNNDSNNLYRPGNQDITKVNIKNTIRSIPTGAFSNLAKLAEVDIPSSVTHIASRSFSGCNALNNIKIASGNTTYITNGTNIVDKTTNTLIYGNSNATIDESITSIGEYAYENAAITNLTIPNTVTSIGAHAFKNCVSLKSLDLTSYTTPPTLGDNSFEGCSALSEINLQSKEVADIFKSQPGWKDIIVPFVTPGSKCFTITLLEDDTLVGFRCRKIKADPVALNLQWRVDGGDWQSQTDITSDITFGEYDAGQKIEVKAKGTNATFSLYSGTTIQSFWGLYCANDRSIGKQCNVSGNICSLLDESFTEDSVLPEGVSFSYLLSTNDAGSSDLIDASMLFLPSNTVDYCYSLMFSTAYQLVKAPKLPATSLANGCYKNMFDGCSSLIEAPDLPAPILVANCYYGMFQNCTSLVVAPRMADVYAADYPTPTTINAACRQMLYGCSSLQISTEGVEENKIGYFENIGTTTTMLYARQMFPDGSMPVHQTTYYYVPQA